MKYYVGYSFRARYVAIVEADNIEEAMEKAEREYYDADFGIAGAIGEGYIFKKCEIIARVPEADLINSLEKIIIESYSLDN